jgi:hypothetical protein
LAGRQKVSTQGRSSTSRDQALRGCRSTSTVALEVDERTDRILHRYPVIDRM